jgi:hypothetical protein
LKIFVICHRCQRHRWSTLCCEYLCDFWIKFEMVLMGYSGAGGKLIHKKTRSKKSRDTVPLRPQSMDYVALRLPTLAVFVITVYNFLMDICTVDLQIILQIQIELLSSSYANGVRELAPQRWPPIGTGPSSVRQWRPAGPPQPSSPRTEASSST